MQQTDLIRNFCIIAHIDHGKSTLADRIIEYTGALTGREMQDQVLDNMDLERERGITIKAQTASMKYKAKDGKTYTLNLIDTPGHVDFSYEVSRSLSACEGALLIVDSTQGVEAQTVANVHLAYQNDLDIIPVINKIDLPSADPDKVKLQIEDELAIEATDAILTSAKTGEGIADILEAIIEQISPPKPIEKENPPLKALIFDSWFDPYLGAVSLIRVMEGSVRKGMKMQMMSSGVTYEVSKMGILTPKLFETKELNTGMVGIVAGSIKTIADTKVGDTITDANHPAEEPLDGFQECKQMVFGGIFPVDSSDYTNLKESMEKLQLNDAALSLEKENSNALGFGFRVGFLGLLHMDIIQERLEREYDLDLIFTAPTVVYKVKTKEGDHYDIENPSKLPDATEIEFVEEPFVLITIHTPEEYIGGILKLLTERRGQQIALDYNSTSRVRIQYELPMCEMIFDFHDKIKSISRGYASMDYEMIDYREGDLVKVDILVNGNPVDALTSIIHRSTAATRSRSILKKLRSHLPRQMFQIALQAAIGGKIIARETISAYRKDVTAKCYGGDISRKRKLLEKQKAGKKRMKQFGNVEIPQSAFLSILQVDDD